MKKTIYFLSLMLLSLSMLACCGKASHNGHVDGNWEIMSIENRQDGTVTVPDQHFIALYLHVVNLFPNGISGNMHYSKHEQKISMDFPYSESESGAAALRLYGIYTNPVVFEVLKADRKQLVLRTPETVITCRRY